MVGANIEELISILKYIDIDYMTDDECNSIHCLDINNDENQKMVIQKYIVIGVNSEYSKEAKLRAKEVLNMCISNISYASNLFDQMSFPFKNKIEDKKAFLEKIYTELFG